MKIITTYIAFDDTEFDTMEECVKYEAYYTHLMIEADECFRFYDYNADEITFLYCHNIEEMLEEFCNAYDNCKYITVSKEPSVPLIDFIWRYAGFTMPIEKGDWQYNYNEGKWVSAS